MKNKLRDDNPFIGRFDDGKILWLSEGECKLYKILGRLLKLQKKSKGFYILIQVL